MLAFMERETAELDWRLDAMEHTLHALRQAVQDGRAADVDTTYCALKEQADQLDADFGAWWSGRE